MKKNVMMRVASVLMVAVLLTTCAISGTFAKYVTSDSAADSARVAKFGVVVTADGSLFDTTYKTTANVPGAGAADTDGIVLSVESSDTDKLVAPGTKNTDGITFVVTGTPEVDVQIDVVVGNTTANNDVYLKQATGLPNMTTGNATDTFDNDADYYPVKYTLTQTKGGATTTTSGLNRAGLESALEGLTKRVDANTDLAGADGIGTIKITWEWDFDNSGAGTYDMQDTLLGDLAAGTTLTPAKTLTAGTDYNLNAAFDISITVTQID